MTDELAVDLVCGMKVPTATSVSSNVQGNDYYFCCERCQKSFLRKPHLYIGQQPGR
jgi:YHS domain-containing protein